MLMHIDKDNIDPQDLTTTISIWTEPQAHIKKKPGTNCQGTQDRTMPSKEVAGHAREHAHGQEVLSHGIGAWN
jgi:hypothetical protein